MRTAAALRARSVWLEAGAAVDLVTVAGGDGWVWERDHSGFAGRGTAVRIPLPAGLRSAAETVAGVLASIPDEDAVGVPGSSPVAVGALPFDRHAPAELIVPALVVGRNGDGRCWLTTVGDTVDPDHVLGTLVHAPPQDPDGFGLSSPVPHEEWMRLVGLAVADIEAGRLSKVVLAREIGVSANRPIHVETVLRRLRSLYPACTLVSAGIAGSDDSRFVAASPELLVSRIGDRVRSHPLAGTIPRSGDADADRLLAEALLGSAKDRAEHAWVVSDVERALAPWCSSLSVPAEPSIVPLRNVSHLGTLVEGRLAAGAPPSALALAAALHPTAAVAGTPRDEALAWLTENEQLERGPYAGPAGWVDANGDGEWVVGIRSAVVSGTTARLFAGVGVVDGSDPAAELAETQFKLQALLAAIVRP